MAKVHFQECCPLPLCGCWSVMKFTDVRSELRLAQAEEAPEAAMRLPWAQRLGQVCGDGLRGCSWPGPGLPLTWQYIIHNKLSLTSDRDKHNLHFRDLSWSKCNILGIHHLIYLINISKIADSFPESRFLHKMACKENPKQPVKSFNSFKHRYWIRGWS